jgi:hypothetical protein
MLKGASRAVLKIVEEEMHQAWRSGYEEGKSEVARDAVTEILSARFGTEAGALSSLVQLVVPDRLSEIIILAAACADPVSFREGIPSLMRNRRSRSRDRDRRTPRREAPPGRPDRARDG